MIVALLPGLGADERFFAPLVAALGERGVHVVVPRWIEPRPTETMTEYAARFAADRSFPRVDVVGGASFGGMVAREIAAHSRARALVQLGSALEPERIFALYRLCAGLPLPSFAHDVMKAFGTQLSSVFGARTREERALFGAMLRDTPTAFMSWAVRAIGSWRASALDASTRVLTVHGTRDLLLDAKRARADVLVDGAGHLLAYSHAQECAAAMVAHLRG